MKISMNYGEGVLSLPLGVMDKIESISENELKLLVFISRECALGESFAPEKASTALGISPQEVESCLAFLRGAGLIKVSGAKKNSPGAKNDSRTNQIHKISKRDDKSSAGFSDLEDIDNQSCEVRIITNTPPQYSGRELDALVNSNEVIARLKQAAESDDFFGKPLRHADLNKLVSLVDYFSFDEAYILQLLSISRDKSAAMSYAFRLGADFYSKGILTFDALLQELTKLEQKNSFEGKMRKLFGIEKRTLTSKEKRFFEQWQSYDFQLVEYAYEITVDSTGTASMPYMNKILTSFAEKGIKSVEMAKQEALRYKQQSVKSDTAFNEKDFFAIALEGSYNKKDDKKGGEHS